MIQTTVVEPSFPIQIAQEDIPTVVELPKLTPEQQSFVQQVFESQQKEKVYLFQQLQKKEESTQEIEEERRLYRQTMLRHATAFSFSIVNKFEATIKKSPELKAMLGINPKSKELKLDELMDKLERLLREENPPQGYKDDKEMEEWIWSKRGIDQLLKPVFDDIKIYMKTYGVENLKAHCPDILEKDFEEQLRKVLDPTPAGMTKLEIAGKTLEYTFYGLYYMCCILLNVSKVARFGLFILKIPLLGLL